MLVNLAQILDPAARRGAAVASFNVFGWEDARAVVEAAAALGAPVIVAANLNFRQFMPLEPIAAMLCRLARDVSTPVCVHLDHCYETAEAARAIEAGFTSVMYDGSQLSVDANLAETGRVVQLAHAAGCSVEAEIGSVPYAEGRAHIRSELSDPLDAGRLARESGADALAVSIGNVHRLNSPAARIDFERLRRIREVVSIPLVIHGTSGIWEQDIQRLVAAGIAKFNIGTTLRQAFGRALRETLARHPERFDRLEIMSDVMPAIANAAAHMIRLLGWGDSVRSAHQNQCAAAGSASAGGSGEIFR
jgi:fructose-bisphosphate aldolase, class II